VNGTFNNDTASGKVNETIWFTPNSSTPSSIIYQSVNNSLTRGTITILDL
jgi:hypothetical protein